MSWEVRQGDALEQLREMDAESVQTCVTSPPYRTPNHRLPTHGPRRWDGPKQTQGAMSGHASAADRLDRETCGSCGAKRIDSQLGLEPTPEEYVANLVAVFREVRRVLRDDGTLWLNLGDSYTSGNSGQMASAQSGGMANKVKREQAATSAPRQRLAGAKPKDLVGIPWRTAFALQADGWWLRSDIIWSKPNPMPESVTDRPTKAHEYLFLLTKSARYFYDADAIREAHSVEVVDRPVKHEDPKYAGRRNGVNRVAHGAGRNRRSVWEIATQPYAEAHFATFPPKLVEPCILAGSRSEEAIHCPECDTEVYLGHDPECSGPPADYAPAVVLDPFCGSGTTGVVALRHDRSFIGIELSPQYVELARRRIVDDAPLLNSGLEVAA